MSDKSLIQSQSNYRKIRIYVEFYVVELKALKVKIDRCGIDGSTTYT